MSSGLRKSQVFQVRGCDSGGFEGEDGLGLGFRAEP